MSRGRRALRKAGLLATGLAVLLVVAWIALTRGPMAPQPVTMATAAHEDLQPVAFGIGTVEARRRYLIGPTQAARVLAVHADQGDLVRVGQLLVEFDPVDLEARLAAAASSRARATYAVDIAQAQAEEARSRAALAAGNAARYRDLVRKGFVSREAGEVKEYESRAATAAAEAAEAAVEAARGDLRRAFAEHDALVRQRANFRLTSPVDGIVLSREAEPGTTLVAGQAALQVVERGSFWVSARFDQTQAGAIMTGLPAQIVLRSRGKRPLEGRVVRVELGSDPVTEERIVNLEFPGDPGNLSIGELAEVSIGLPAVADVVSVPSAAVRRLGRDEGVWRVADGRVAFVPVRTGVRTLDGRTEILGGVQPGDRVVLHSMQQLRDGARVKIEPSLAGT